MIKDTFKPKSKKLRVETKVGKRTHVDFLQMSMPDLSELKNDAYLLIRAAILWENSENSPYPPLEHEIIWRDETWDNEVLLIKQAMDYIRDAHKRKTQGLD